LGRHELGPERAQDPDKAKSRDRVAGREVPVECGPDVVELREQRAVRGVLAWATHIIGEAVNQAGEVLGMPGTNGDLFAAAVEVLVRPIDGASQRLVTPRMLAVDAQELETVLEVVDDLGWCHRVDSDGGELERQRDAVEAPAELSDVGLVLGGQSETPRHGAR